MSSSDDSNPLKSVLNLLQEASELVGEVEPPLQVASSGFSEVKGAVDKVNNFITDAKDVQDVVKVVRDAAYALDEVPGVDVVSAPVGTILSKVLDFMDPIVNEMSEFQNGVLKEVKGVVDDGASIAGKIYAAANDFHTGVPKWINTANVLYYTVQLAIPLAKIMESTSVGSSMKQLIDQFNTIGSDVESVAKVVHEGLSDAWNAAKSVVMPVIDAFKDAFAFFAKLGVITAVMNILKPVKEALDAILDALKPVMWALKAVECVFDKVVKPVIDEILKKTGIEKLIDGLEKKIMDALGITGVVDKLKKAFHLEGFKTAATSLSSPASKVSSYPKLKAAFGGFVSDPQQALVAAVVSAISGSIVIPGAPAPPLPPFPPDIVVKGQAPAARLMHAKMPMALLAYTEPSTAQVIKLQPYTFQPLMLAAVTTSDAAWPGVDTLLSNIDKTIANIQGVVPTGQALEKALASVPKLEQAPQLLHSNLGDLFTIMKTLHVLSSFLQKFPFLSVFLKPVTESLADEELSIQHLQSDTGRVVSYSNSIVASIKHMTAEEEDSSLTQALNQLTTTLQHWKHEVMSYTAQIDDGYARDAKLKNKYKPQLDGLKQKMLDRVSNLTKTLVSVSQLAQNLADSGHSLSNEISELNGSLMSTQEPISDLESAIARVHSGVHIAQELDSVFKPLQWLLTDFHCIPDKERPIKQEYLKLVNAFADGSQGLTFDESAKAALKVLENKIIPVQTVSSTVKSALTVLQPLSANIPTLVTSYLSKLKSLASMQIGSETYTYSYGNGKVMKISSHFLDEDTVELVLSLSKEIESASSG